MTEPLKLPIGIENFAEIRKAGFYYADKSRLIEQLLRQWGKVNQAKAVLFMSYMRDCQKNTEKMADKSKRTT